MITTRFAQAVGVTSQNDFRRADVDAILRRMRTIGWGLLVAAMVIDATEARVLRVRRRMSMVPQQLVDRMELRGTAVAILGQSLLEASSSEPRTKH